MNALPFNQPGRFYRGNLHTHSTRSDGRLSPEAVCKYYRENGFDFISLTDHFMERYGYPITDTTPYRSDDFTTLLGAELHAPQTVIGDLWHILAVGLPLDFPRNLPDETGVQIANRALDAGAYVAVAHPWWYSLTEEDVISLGDRVQAIETINGISADHNDRIDSWYMLDAMMARGRRYHGLATDDAHFKDKFNDTLRGWVWVKSEALTPEALLDALKAGAFYSSTGPMIHDVQVTPDTVKIRCSPAQAIFVTGRGSRANQLHGGGITEAELNIRRLDSPYIRITVRDVHGGRAWTNPIALTV